jgi:hypothetical protein
MANKTQEFSNHARFVPLFHFVTLGTLLVILIGSIINLFTDENAGQLISWLFLLLVITVISTAFFARSFALKAQDRAIRAEENLRYYLITGKRLSLPLTIHQIIALRFASDEEFVELTEKAIRENLSPKDIKKTINAWRPDFHRA